MSLFAQILGVNAIFVLLSLILCVVFGQVTVRRLRKNTATKHALGTEFASGWDIINAAQALAFPKAWSEKLEKSKISFLYANAALIRAHTTKIDHILGFLFYWLFIISNLSLALLVLLNALGLFD